MSFFATVLGACSSCLPCLSKGDLTPRQEQRSLQDEEEEDWMPFINKRKQLSRNITIKSFYSKEKSPEASFRSPTDSEKDVLFQMPSRESMDDVDVLPPSPRRPEFIQDDFGVTRGRMLEPLRRKESTDFVQSAGSFPANIRAQMRLEPLRRQPSNSSMRNLDSLPASLRANAGIARNGPSAASGRGSVDRRGF